MCDIWEERRYNKTTDDGRSSYAKDYARVVHSSAFRRLQNKTQVFGFGIGDSDFYRTRLTHSMEVSQIGEGIVRFLLYNSANKNKEENVNIICGHTNENEARDINPDCYTFLIRAICLAHDLGHAPFGHGGEKALNRCMCEHGGFEANGQTLRILTSIPSYDKIEGMNLCRRSLLGVLKYPAPYSSLVNKELYDKEQHYQKTVKYNPSVPKAELFKPPKCYLDTEKGVVEWISKKLNDKDWEKVSMEFEEKNNEEHQKIKYKALDTSIMEIADDIAYGIHDLEDAISLKLINQAIFVECVSKEKMKPFLEWNDATQCGRDYDTFVKNLFANEYETYKRKKAIGSLVDFCIRHTKIEDRNDNMEDNDKKFSSPIFRYQVVLEKKVADILKALRDFIFEKVIKSTTVQQLEYKGRKIITELFHAYATDPTRLLTEKDRKRYKAAEGDETSQFRVICDYISGMTDEYAIKRYEQLFEPRMGSVFDRL